jgi:hypothetical protein
VGQFLIKINPLGGYGKHFQAIKSRNNEEISLYARRLAGATEREGNVGASVRMRINGSYSASYNHKLLVRDYLPSKKQPAFELFMRKVLFQVHI